MTTSIDESVYAAPVLLLSYLVLLVTYFMAAHYNSGKRGQIFNKEFMSQFDEEH